MRSRPFLAILLAAPLACSTSDPTAGRLQHVAQADTDDDDDDGGGRPPDAGHGRPADPGCGLLCARCTIDTDCCNATWVGMFAPDGTERCVAGTCVLLDAGAGNCAPKGKCCVGDFDCCNGQCVNGKCQ